MEGSLNGKAWRKSSYSGTDAGNCVEVGHFCRKSTYGDTSGECCTEVGRASAVLIRDTTDREGPALAFPATTWRAFTSALT